MSITNRRFVVNEEGYIIDTLNPIYNPRCQHFRGREPEDEKYLRERLFMERLRGLMEKLLIDPDSRIRWVILSAIRASHLNTFDPAASIQRKSYREFKRQKVGMQYFTSLSLFCDDVDAVLCELYGDDDREAVDRVVEAVRDIVYGSLRQDLWKEQRDAEDFDYIMYGIGLAVGDCVCGSDWRCGMQAKFNLFSRVREVRANPSAFSEYTVEFVRRFEQEWDCRLCPRCGRHALERAWGTPFAIRDGQCIELSEARPDEIRWCENCGPADEFPTPLALAPVKNKPILKLVHELKQE
jgi:hypothetical protein